MQYKGNLFANKFGRSRQLESTLRPTFSKLKSALKRQISPSHIIRLSQVNVKSITYYPQYYLNYVLTTSNLNCGTCLSFYQSNTDAKCDVSFSRKSLKTFNSFCVASEFVENVRMRLVTSNYMSGHNNECLKENKEDFLTTLEF